MPKASGFGLLLDHPRQQREVIILHQDHRPLRVFDLLQQGLGELAVDCLIPLPVHVAKDGSGMRDVAERPQAFVGEAVVIAFFLFLRQPHPAQRVLRIVWRHLQVIVAVHKITIRRTAAVRHPGAVGSAKHRFQRRDQAARRHADLH